jgi:hypothetical protein
MERKDGAVDGVNAQLVLAVAGGGHESAAGGDEVGLSGPGGNSGEGPLRFGECGW